MKKPVQTLCNLAFCVLYTMILPLVLFGCCINSRSWKIDEEIPAKQRYLPSSGYYHCYKHTTSKDTIYKYSSYNGGPWANSDIYPATRVVLNMLSFHSYSSAASGDYMLIPFDMMFYPVILCELPVQFVLDTVLLPYDIIAAPTCPEGYSMRY